jgi:hypothetical protein
LPPKHAFDVRRGKPCDAKAAQGSLFHFLVGLRRQNERFLLPYSHIDGSMAV